MKKKHIGEVICAMMDDATARALRSVLTDTVFQNLIGGGEWSVSEAHEELIWNLIRAIDIQCGKKRD